MVVFHSDYDEIELKKISYNVISKTPSRHWKALLK